MEKIFFLWSKGCKEMALSAICTAQIRLKRRIHPGRINPDTVATSPKSFQSGSLPVMHGRVRIPSTKKRSQPASMLVTSWLHTGYGVRVIELSSRPITMSWDDVRLAHGEIVSRSYYVSSTGRKL
jgi:hypothetical protein